MAVTTLDVRINALVEGLTSVQRLQQDIDTLVSSLASVSAPSTQAGDSLSRLETRGVSLESVLLRMDSFIDQVSRSLNALSTDGGSLAVTAAAQSAQVELGQLSQSAASAEDSLSRVGQTGLGNTTDEVQTVRRSLSELSAAATDTGRSIGSSASNVTASFSTMQQGADRLNARPLETLTGATTNYSQSISALSTRLGTSITGFQSYQDTVTGLNTSYATGAEATTAYSTSVNSLQREFGIIGIAARSSGLALDDVSRTVDSTSSVMQDLADSSLDTEQGLQSIARVDASGFARVSNGAEELGVSFNNLVLRTEATASGFEDLDGAVPVDTIAEAADSLDTTSAALGGTDTAASAAGGSLDGLGQAAGDAGDALTDAGEGAGAAGGALNDIEDPATQAAGNLGALATPLQNLVGYLKGVVAGIAAFAAVASLKDAADYAARIETLGVTMEVVGANAGYSKEQLQGYESEVKKLGITSDAARDAIIQMSAAGLELGAVTEGGASQIAEMARASQDLAVVLGENSSETLTRFITNVQQLDTEGLRYMGITLDVAAAQEKFALSIGKSTESLTQQQKTQAVMTEALDQARKMSGAYEASLETVGKKLSSMSRLSSELSEVIGNNLLPAYGALVDRASAFLKTAKDQVESMDEGGAAADNYRVAMKDLADGIFDAMDLVVDVVVDANQGFSILVAQIAGLFNDILSLAGVVQDVGDETISIGEIIGGFLTVVSLGVALVRDAITVVLAMFTQLGGGIFTVLGYIVQGVGRVIEIITLGAVPAIRELGDAWVAQGTAANVAAGQMVNGVLAGEGALGEFNKQLMESGSAMEKLGQGKNFQAISTEIQQLTEAQRLNTLTSTEVADGQAAITARIRQLGEAGIITEKQVSILENRLRGVSNKTQGDFNKAFELMGIALADLKNRTSEEGGQIASGLNQLASNAMTTSDIFIDSFDISLGKAATINDLTQMVTAVEDFGKRSTIAGEETKLSLDQISEASNMTKGRFTELLDESLKTSKTSGQFKDLATDVQALGDKLVSAGVMSAEELAQALNEIEIAAGDAKEELANLSTVKAVEELGLSFAELKTGVSDSMDGIVTQLDRVLVQSSLTSTELAKVFASSIDEANTLGDLEKLAERLSRAKEEGQLFGREYSASLTELGSKFEEVFSTKLSTANTETEFASLRENVKQLGESGVLSGTQVNLALAEIAEKATGARESVLRLASQMTELSTSALSVTEAETASYRARLDVLGAQNQVTQAYNKYQIEGTELSRLQLIAKQEDLQLARERLALSERIAEREQAAYEVLIAQQRLLNAEKAKGLSNDLESANLAVALATRELEGRQKVLETAKQSVSAQAQQVSMTERAAAAANFMAEEFEASQKSAEDMAATMSEVGDAVERSKQATNDLSSGMLGFSQSGIEGTLREMGIASGEAASRAKEMFESSMSAMRASQSMMTNYFYINDQLAKLQQQLDIEADRDAKRAERAREILDNYQRVKDAAEGIGRAADTADQKWVGFGSGGLSQVGEAMRQIRQDALDVAEAATSSVASFLSSTRSIQEELLKAQGREQEAVASRFAARKQELALEYEMLKVKIEGAVVTAKAAGISTAGLEEAKKQAAEGFAQAAKALVELERIELDKFKLQEAQRKEKEARAAAAEEKAAQTARTASATNNALSNAAARASAPAAATTAANNALTAPASSQTVKVDLTLNGKSVPVTVDSGEKGNLLELLEELKRRS